MGIFILLSGGLTCAFFLYVLVQFHKELQRAEGNGKGKPGGRLRNYTKRLSARRAELTEKKIQRIMKVVRKRAEMRREGRAREKSNHSGGIPYVETIFPIGFVVTPIPRVAGPGTPAIQRNR